MAKESLECKSSQGEFRRVKVWPRKVRNVKVVKESL